MAATKAWTKWQLNDFENRISSSREVLAIAFPSTWKMKLIFTGAWGMCWYIASNLMVHSLIFLNKRSFTQYHAIKLRKKTVSSSVLAVILVSVYLQVAVMLCWCVGILGVVLGIIRNSKSVLLSVGSHFKVSREHGVLSVSSLMETSTLQPHTPFMFTHTHDTFSSTFTCVVHL